MDEQYIHGNVIENVCDYVGLAVTLNRKTRTVGALRISRARPPKIPHVQK